MSLRLKFGRKLVSGSIGPPLSETASEHDNSGRPELLAGFCRQRFDYCDVWHQILWKAMSLLKILGTVIRQPDLALGIFPDQNLERKVDSAAGRRQHQWRAELSGCQRLTAWWEAFSFPPFLLPRCGQQGQTA